MKIYFMPQNRIGKWSVKFSIAFVVLMALSQILAISTGQYTTDGTSANSSIIPIIIVTGLLALASGIASFCTGIFSIVKNKERSVWVFLTTFIGLLIIMFLIGEFTFPH